MAADHLHAVPDPDETAAPSEDEVSLLEAVRSGDVLEMLLAQRRLIAEALITAADNTRPQYNNELNKLHALIAAEQKQREAAVAAAAEQEAASSAGVADEPLDSSTL